jgi:hypothetical protein
MLYLSAGTRSTPLGRIRHLVITHRVDPRPGERERRIMMQRFLDRWLRAPSTRPILSEAVRHTTHAGHPP